jgi:hypothetical protein
MTWLDRQPWWLEVLVLAVVLAVVAISFWIAYGSVELLGPFLVFCGAVSGVTLRRRRLSKPSK